MLGGLGVNSPPKIRASSLSSHASVMGSAASGSANVGIFLPVNAFNVLSPVLFLDSAVNASLVVGFNEFVIKCGFVK